MLLIQRLHRYRHQLKQKMRTMIIYKLILPLLKVQNPPPVCQKMTKTQG